MSTIAETAIAYRFATADDIGAIVALVESAFRGDVSRKGWTTEADILDGQRTDPAGVGELIDRPVGGMLLGERGGDLIACLHVEQRGEAGYLGMFSVRPDLQGAGVGGAMLSEAERIAREDWRSCEMQMTVISVRDDLIAWYARRGYRRTGRYSPFPYGDERFGIPKRDDLCFELLVKPL